LEYLGIYLLWLLELLVEFVLELLEGKTRVVVVVRLVVEYLFELEGIFVPTADLETV